MFTVFLAFPDLLALNIPDKESCLHSSSLFVAPIVLVSWGCQAKKGTALRVGVYEVKLPVARGTRA